MNYAERAARFWSRLDRSAGDDGCWVWTGAKNANGYGILEWGGQMKRAHRLAWELTYGPIPKGLHVCHRCDHPSCCNALKHLFLGTNQDNVTDRSRKHRTAKLTGQRNPQAKLTDDEIVRLRRRALNGESRQSLSDSFGLSISQVRRILLRLQRT